MPLKELQTPYTHTHTKHSYEEPLMYVSTYSKNPEIFTEIIKNLEQL